MVFETFRNKNFYGEGLSAPRLTSKLEDHPLSAVRDCLFNIVAVTLRIWSLSLHPQPEDAPRRCDKRSTSHGTTLFQWVKINLYVGMVLPVRAPSTGIFTLRISSEILKFRYAVKLLEWGSARRKMSAQQSLFHLDL